MTSRERFVATMNYQPRDRAPFQEFPWPTWPETAERWAKEGGYDPQMTDFGCDRWAIEYSWFMPCPPFSREIVAENDDHVTYVDDQGIVLRELKHNPKSSMPQFLRFPVKTRAEFRKFWRERMSADLSQRIGADWRELLRRHRHRDYPLVIIADRWGGLFGALRNLVGLETLCELFYDDLSFVEEMMDADVEFMIAMMAQILEETDIDVFGFWEDMAYHTAPLISPEMVRLTMVPRYRKVVEFGRAHGVHYFGLDSDGFIDPLIPMWMDAGIDIIYPFEVAAHMDVVAAREKYGRGLRIWGGVDKRVLARGPAAIDAELSRIAPLIRDGGYVPTLDHSATPDIPFQAYRYFMERLSASL